ncbi:PLP-dependent aminotransferase family protein [Stenotrophomonas sp. MH1]|uniref:PLP-dependent aminotransferase family protein n=1 Tax=Stenotrophomonas capsici TaxID=3110230 RepID=A0ABU5V8J0_9GAMM|nr:PLP-dependent aminotransferase family protein [Stenotrophomonas sp. MH1]MEA5669552.1 PLP-dependent aminotransferase family protein [Stenotrophomonas sp. MH1]
MTWIDNALASNGPIYLRIVDTIERTVNTGELAPGHRLPSQRALAKQLGIDLTTVTRAFDEARRRGLIEARGPQGSFIAPPKAAFGQPVDMSMNVPPVPDAAALNDALRRGAAAVLARSNAPNLMTYHLTGGSRTDLHAATGWLEPMLGKVDEARLVVAEGAQFALTALLVSQTREGDALLCDRLVYPGLLQLADSLGRRLIAVDADADGMRPDQLERAARLHGARMVYFNPTCNNPTALTIPPLRRAELARVLQQHDLLAIEDDPYWHHDASRPAPIAAFAPAHVHYVSTLSKAISPGLRTAFVHCPSAAHAETLARVLRALCLMGQPFGMALASQLLLDGSAQALLEQALAEARERARLADHLLSPYLRAQVGGLHAWCTMPPPWTDTAFAHAAQLQSLAVSPSSTFSAVDQPLHDGVRLSLGLAPDRRQLESALRRINQLLTDTAPARLQG